ncbi:hypothetical protein [Emticicia agri]|uniref:Uncharacterized protein n=1 Tax=Emticicia agri TaxID=2492393 RepID=A0A4Q5LVQ7_9BACT|nr:hypothetical protein [Emticicia agri]RYU93808.1 hypothetical protein EWM59_20010 [Emticicia agri]
MKTENWTCDTCGQPIKRIKDGWIEWLSKADSLEGYGLRLVHHKSASPLATSHGCYYDEEKTIREENAFVANSAVDYYLGADGLVNLLELMHGDLLPKNEVIEMIMRLHVPGYEQARKYIETAMAEGIIREKEFPEFRTQDELQVVIDWVGV